jgi:hypothetical protein
MTGLETERREKMPLPVFFLNPPPKKRRKKPMARKTRWQAAIAREVKGGRHRTFQAAVRAASRKYRGKAAPRKRKKGRKKRNPWVGSYSYKRKARKRGKTVSVPK